jgi:hypothetical protein
MFTRDHTPLIPDREPLDPLSRLATLLRSATSGASPFEEPPHLTNRIRVPFQDQRAGSSPSGARSVANSNHVARRDQVIFDAYAKKILR